MCTRIPETGSIQHMSMQNRGRTSAAGGLRTALELKSPTLPDSFSSPLSRAMVAVLRLPQNSTASQPGDEELLSSGQRYLCNLLTMAAPLDVTSRLRSQRVKLSFRSKAPGPIPTCAKHVASAALSKVTLWHLEVRSQP